MESSKTAFSYFWWYENPRWGLPRPSINTLKTTNKQTNTYIYWDQKFCNVIKREKIEGRQDLGEKKKVTWFISVTLPRISFKPSQTSKLGLVWKADKEDFSSLKSLTQGPAISEPSGAKKSVFTAASHTLSSKLRNSSSCQTLKMVCWNLVQMSNSFSLGLNCIFFLL